MSCKLKDYYKEGVPLDKSAKIILGLLDNEKAIVDEVLRDYSPFNLISRNLESLGFLNHIHPPAAPEVTTRGGTLVLSQRPYIDSRLRKSISSEMKRFVLLKAVRDADWECFVEFYVARLEVPKNLSTKKAIREYIRGSYYPRFSEANMNHWYELHLSLAEETNIDNVLKGQSNLEEGVFNSLDPYSEDFNATRFFARPLEVPTLRELKDFVEKALSVYKDELLGPSFVGHCETLKTIIQTLLLDADLFADEVQLSEKVINILKGRGIGLMRSNYPILTEGRGIIDFRGNEQTSFKLFSLS